MSTSRGPRTDGKDWRPSASPAALRARADLLATIRSFFASRDVLEVETPILAAHPVTDIHLATFSTSYAGPGARDGDRFHLGTSPELAMKRLLAASPEPIFQICKAFRNGEAGRFHNPEFTILEWYRPGWDHHDLMDEVEALLVTTLGVSGSERRSYGDLFHEHTGIDPHTAELSTLRRALAETRAPPEIDAAADLTQALFSACVEPHLGRQLPTFVYDYPASQAALARLRPGSPAVAERFELYHRGVELANGFHELCDAEEQRERFAAEQRERLQRGLPEAAADGRFLAALEEGLPDCSGVALGVDRLLMLLLGCDDIRKVLAFPFEQA